MTAPANPSAPRVPGRNLWPYGIVLAFVLFVSGTVGLIVLASFHRPELVTANYYERDLHYQQIYERRARAAALGAEASVTLDVAAHRIRVVLPPHHAGRQPVGLIRLYRPAAANADRQFPLALDVAGSQELDARPLAPGLWRVHVEWSVADQTYSLERQLVLPYPPR